MIALMFPGQGSQRRGMGEGLFDEVREYAALERDVDAIVGYSMRKLCLEDPQNRLKDTQFTQPALYVVNALHLYKLRSEGVQASTFIGHSLGEYNALLAAGVFDFLTGLRLVKRRSELMAGSRNGGMAAVVGLEMKQVVRVLQDSGSSTLDVANYNAPLQTVISGPLEAIERAGPLFERAGAQMYIPLLVSAAFHSRYMAEVGREFEQFLDAFMLRAPQGTVVANVTAEPYPSEPQYIKARLSRQITQPVRWTQSIQLLLAQGVSDFREVGPGNVLTRLLQQIQQARPALA